MPRAMLPEVKDNARRFRHRDARRCWAPTIPICGSAGDQQAATIGQACFEPGMMKSTYGTGCFALLNTGSEIVRSRNRLLTTIAYRLNGKTTYALEGAIFVAGASVQWLRDMLGMFEESPPTPARSAKAPIRHAEVYLVPAFVGLGAPWWDAEARGAIYGLTRNYRPVGSDASGARVGGLPDAATCSTAMRRDWKGAHDTVLRVDGGMVASDWTMQFLADILDVAGGPADHPGNDGARGGVACGLQGRRLAGHGRVRARWALDRQFNPSDGPDAAEEEARGLAQRGEADADCVTR